MEGKKAGAKDPGGECGILEELKESLTMNAAPPSPLLSLALEIINIHRGINEFLPHRVIVRMEGSGSNDNNSDNNSYHLLTLIVPGTRWRTAHCISFHPRHN